MAKLKKRVTVVLSLTRYNRLGDFRYKVVGVSADIAANPTLFATPLPTVATVDTNIGLMDDGQALVEQRKPGGVDARDAAYNVVVDNVRTWLRYVQNLIDAEPDPIQQMLIANSSGFDIRVNGVYIKPPLRIIPLETPGQLKLLAVAAGQRAAYSWQMSSNNGASWVDLPVTNSASTTVTGLATGARLLFRYHYTVKNIAGPWSFNVSVIVQ